MQGHFGCRMAFGPESSDHLRREMQPGRRSGDRSLEPGVDRLVAAVVQLLALAAEVRRDRNPSELLEQLPERERRVPDELDDLMPAAVPGSGRFEPVGPSAEPECDLQRSVFPFFQIADDALPAAAAVRGKGALVIGGGVRLETEYFDARAGRLVENQPGSDHFRVVEYEHRTLGQKPPDPLEAVLGDAAVAADEQLRLLAPLERKFGDAPFGQRVVVVGYADVAFHGQSG